MIIYCASYVFLYTIHIHVFVHFSNPSLTKVPHNLPNPLFSLNYTEHFPFPRLTYMTYGWVYTSYTHLMPNRITLYSIVMFYQHFQSEYIVRFPIPSLLPSLYPMIPYIFPFLVSQTVQYTISYPVSHSDNKVQVFLFPNDTYISY